MACVSSWVCVILAVDALCIALGTGERLSPDAILSYDTLRYSPAVVKRHTSAGPLLLDLHFRNMTLELKRSRVVFKSEARSPPLYDPSTFYRGRVSGDPHSRVYGHVVDGLFDGVIHTTDGQFHVESSAKYFEHPQAFHSIVYRSEDVAFPPNVCGHQQPLYDALRKVQSSAPRQQWQRSKRQQTQNQFCSLLVAVDDRFLRSIANNNPAAAMSEVVTIIAAVRDIFSRTDFDNEGNADGIEPIIAEIRVMDGTEPGYRYGSSNIDVNSFLDLWSQEDHTGFCLALLLTYRDFANGVLGLAWVAEAPPGNRGGICEERVDLPSGVRSLNTAIVSLLNFGVRQPRPVTIITVAHEFGHNFGSPHDSSSNAQCVPGAGGGGNYIMFAQATDGTQRNNDQFSPCSRQSINRVLQSSRSDCFTASPSVCGNGVLEEGEQCDCGSLCDSLNCCDDDCRFIGDSQCSPPAMCCQNNCTYLPPTTLCRNATDCGQETFCTGVNATCPAPARNEDASLCNNDQNVCLDGECVGSLCVSVGREECQCTEEIRRCEICCIDNNGQCVSSLQTNLGFIGDRLEPGRACNNFQGYCDQDRLTCITVDNDDLLDDLRNIFTLNTLNKIVAFLTVYWYVPVIVVVAIAIFILLLHFTYRKRKPIKRRLSSVRRGSLRRQGGANQTDAATPTRSAGGGQREISQREALLRLRKFFPTAEADTMTGVLQASRTESKAVRRMLDLGYPLRKLPIPTA